MRSDIKAALSNFRHSSPVLSALHLCKILGYESKRRIELAPNTAERFVQTFDRYGEFDQDRARIQEWKSMHLLFQLTESDIVTDGDTQNAMEYQAKNETLIQSNLYFLLRLNSSKYNRNQLIRIAREINKVTPMPAIVIFQYDMYLALAAMNRRVSKRNSSRDVLEEISLVMDINYANPDQAHIEFLLSLSLKEVYRQFPFQNFPEFYRAWQLILDAFDSSKLLNSKTDGQKQNKWRARGINETYNKPYKIIPELFGLAYEDIFDDVVYEAEEESELRTSLVDGRYTII